MKALFNKEVWRIHIHFCSSLYCTGLGDCTSGGGGLDLNLINGDQLYES